MQATGERLGYQSGVFGETLGFRPEYLDGLNESFAGAVRKWHQDFGVEPFLDRAIRNGRANDVFGALIFLQDEFLRGFNGKKTVALTDFHGGLPSSVLSLQRGESSASGRNAYSGLQREIGRMGHKLMERSLLASGNGVSERVNLQPALIDFPPGFTGEVYGEADLNPEFMGVLWDRLRYAQEPFADSGLSWDEQYFSSRLMMAELCETAAAEPVMADFVDGVKRRTLNEGPYGAYLGSLGILEFMMMNLSLYDEAGRRRAIIPEVRVFNPKHNPNVAFSLGRADGFEVTEIEGREPTEAEQAKLRLLAKGKYGSAGEWVRYVQAWVNPDVKVTCLDWKGSVSDSPTPGTMLDLSTQIEPPAKHVAQGRGYVAVATADSYLERRSKGEAVPEGWPEKTPFAGYKLVYGDARFGQVVPYEEELDIDRQRVVFVDGVVNPLQQAMERADERQLLNRLVRSISGGGVKTFVMGTRVQPELAIQASFEVKGDYTQEMFDELKDWVDEEHTVQRTGKEDKPSYLLHVDKAIIAGRISPDQDFTRRFSILCPVHKEKTPSCSVYPTGEFHCYGCQAHGRVAYSSLTEDQRRQFAPDSGISVARVHREGKKMGVIPEDLERMMGVAVDLAQSRFWGSAAEKYLTQVRRLDADLAFSMGVGYGDTKTMVGGLLESGFTLEELKKYGMIRFTRNSGRDVMTRNLLSEHGYSSDEMKEDIRTKDGPVEGWPFFPLNRRVLFPLGFKVGERMVYNNFYGRVTWDSEDKIGRHYKLSNGVEHGGFNMEAAQRDNFVLTEGVMDALTFKEMGCEAMAMIGVHNEAILREISKSSREGNEIGVALDTDVTGRAKTLEAMEKLGEFGYLGRVTDFTTEFFELNPEAAGYKDVNEYWKALKNG